MNKILVVDDEEKIRLLIKKYAEFEGYEVTEAKNGIEAVDICSKKDFDIIVLDVMMPELDGFSTAREIRKFSDVPIIILSARGEEYDKIHGFEVGIDDYVVKPFSPREILMRIDAIIKKVNLLVFSSFQSRRLLEKKSQLAYVKSNKKYHAAFFSYYFFVLSLQPLWEEKIRTLFLNMLKWLMQAPKGKALLRLLMVG